MTFSMESVVVAVTLSDRRVLTTNELKKLTLQMELRKVNKISQRYKNIVFGYTRKIQSVFPRDNPYFIIVDLVQHLILLYYYPAFQSEILTDDEQEIFRNLFIENSK